MMDPYMGVKEATGLDGRHRSLLVVFLEKKTQCTKFLLGNKRRNKSGYEHNLAPPLPPSSPPPTSSFFPEGYWR